MARRGTGSLPRRSGDIRDCRRPAHARSGDPAAICDYLGDSGAFDTAITDFWQRYADQNEKDYQQFVTAARSGRLEVLQGV